MARGSINVNALTCKFVLGLPWHLSWWAERRANSRRLRRRLALIEGGQAPRPNLELSTRPGLRPTPQPPKGCRGPVVVRARPGRSPCPTRPADRRAVRTAPCIIAQLPQQPTPIQPSLLPHKLIVPRCLGLRAPSADCSPADTAVRAGLAASSRSVWSFGGSRARRPIRIDLHARGWRRERDRGICACPPDLAVMTALGSGDGSDQPGPACGRARSRAFSGLSAMPWAWARSSF
jgi:hypothetical protein